MKMRKRKWTQNPKFELEEDEEDRGRERRGHSSSDDEEANEDLSLKVVEKALRLRAAKLVPDDADFAFDEPMSLEEAEARAATSGRSGGGEIFASGEKKMVRKGKRKVVKKLKKKQEEIAEQTTAVVNEEKTSDERLVHKSSNAAEADAAGHTGPAGEEEISSTDVGVMGDYKIVRKAKKKMVKKLKKNLEGEEISGVVANEKKTETVGTTDTVETKTTEIADNIVLRKLLRVPRYFDPQDSSARMCYSCCEEGHTAVNCTSVKRKKPCFKCGSLRHNPKSCSKAQDCVNCNKSGHRTQDCPEKQNGNSSSIKVCLKCGDSGHDMFSCTNGYPADDLKIIQCYHCKNFGHLCCVNSGDSTAKDVSCYKCGQSGHTGLACARLRREASGIKAISPCYKCHEEGHFARKCMNSTKVGEKSVSLSTPPILMPHREVKNPLGSKSAPHDIGNVCRTKKPKYEERDLKTPRKSQYRGGVIMYKGGNNWISPATPSTTTHHNMSSLHSSEYRNSLSSALMQWIQSAASISRGSGNAF